MLKQPVIKRQRGLGMIESLIAVVIISIGMLGIAALQLNSMRQSTSAHWHSQAVWLSYEITDRISANSDAATLATFTRYAGIDTNNAPEAANCRDNPCNGDQIRNTDAADWAQLISSLPNGRGVVQAVQDAPNALLISIMWDDNSGETNCPAGVPAAENQTCYSVTLTL